MTTVDPSSIPGAALDVSRGARTTRRTSRAVFLAASLVVSLGLAELMARAVHRGAFPYINIFQGDARYGVRLAPGASTRVRSRTGRVTEITANSLGFRGPEWPVAGAPPLRERVLLLGDSQMFGYGVPYGDSTGAVLERSLGAGRRVLNAAMPSWGPAEYALALRDLGLAYRPRHVVFVVNAANDWFETVPNSQRTTTRDGWAARFGLPEVWTFPGRESLMGRSHLVFAIRRLAHYVAESEASVSESVRLLERDIAPLRRAEAAHSSAVFAALRAVAENCRELGCDVVAVVLPLDVQVDAREWKKYRVPSCDLSATEGLLEDFATNARSLGVTAVNLLPVLRRAEPGAFLEDDYHLSERGHEIVARAIETALNPRPGLREARIAIGEAVP